MQDMTSYKRRIWHCSYEQWPGTFLEYVACSSSVHNSATTAYTHAKEPSILQCIYQIGMRMAFDCQHWARKKQTHFLEPVRYTCNHCIDVELSTCKSPAAPINGWRSSFRSWQKNKQCQKKSLPQTSTTSWEANAFPAFLFKFKADCFDSLPVSIFVAWMAGPWRTPILNNALLSVIWYPKFDIIDEAKHWRLKLCIQVAIWLLNHFGSEIVWLDCGHL